MLLVFYLYPIQKFYGVRIQRYGVTFDSGQIKPLIIFLNHLQQCIKFY